MRQISYERASRFEAALRKLEGRAAAPNPKAMRTARRIAAAVRKDGDKAVLRLAEKFADLDRTQRQRLSLAKNSYRVTEETMAAAVREVPAEFLDAVRFAADNIRRFAEWQMPAPFLRETAAGVEVGQFIKAIESVGCYIPGGRYPLPSTLLMTAIPAQVAGVPRIVACSPRPAPATLAAASILGIREFYAIGGAHAVAAMAYGTKSLAPVLKIVGPGNSFVTAAKQLVSAEGACAIDMLAGPTEALVASDDPEGDAAMIASDLVSQAEHDPEALCIFVTSQPKLAKSVEAQVRVQSRENPVAVQALARNGLILITENAAQTRSVAARIACEHTSMDTLEDAASLDSAGSIFVGGHSAQAFGDYVAGPNHTLPTGALARMRGGLSVLDFVKIVTVQRVTAEGAQRLAGPAVTLARAEGLAGHAASIQARLPGGAARA